MPAATAAPTSPPLFPSHRALSQQQKKATCAPDWRRNPVQNQGFLLGSLFLKGEKIFQIRPRDLGRNSQKNLYLVLFRSQFFRSVFFKAFLRSYPRKTTTNCSASKRGPTISRADSILIL
jgi:hypothetical protein